MKILDFSFIIPVYNRPEEVKELLQSFTGLEGDNNFEIVIIEDGSSLTAEQVVKSFSNELNISYFFKPNSGPGDSRNYGMQRAKGNYFIILDSDVLLPKHYLNAIKTSLANKFYHCFGGPDAAHPTFNVLQKSISFAMTSFLTTGGVRGSKRRLERFQPRSFNMGLSKEAFNATKGFGNIHPGEDPDLSLRLWKKGFKSILINDAFVYHKRRISWLKFYRQVHKFGLARPILNLWHPESSSIVYWFPTSFLLGILLSLMLWVFGFPYLGYFYLLYFTLICTLASYTTKSLKVGIMAVVAVFVQFVGYGFGYLKSTIAIAVFKRQPKLAFPQLFFK